MKTFRCAKFLILGLFILWPTGAMAAAAETEPLAAADRLLQSPTPDVPQALKAVALYEEALAAAKAPEAQILTRLARAYFILGDLAEESRRQGYYESGEMYADKLLKAAPGGVAGHYWKALNLAGQADVGGKLKGRKLLPRIMEELERAVALDPAYDQAGAHRVLGRIYYEAPRRPFSVGDLQKSLEHLTAAVRLAPETGTNHLYLAETLIRLDRREQARTELQQVLTAPRHAIRPSSLAEDRREARRLLQELGEP